MISLHSDSKTFERFFRETYQALCFYASGILHDDAASEDVVQETFLKLLNSDKLFENKDHLKNYLYVAVRNLCIDKCKANQHHVTIDYGSGSEANGEKKHEKEQKWLHSGYVTESLDIQIVRAECLHAIASAIEELPEGQRTVFRLAYLEEKSNEEIANLMNISVNTVKVQKQRAKAHMREKLQDFYPLLFILMKYFV